VTAAPQPVGLAAVGNCIVIAGDWLPVLARALQAAQERRRLNGLPPGRAYRQLALVIEAASAAPGQTDQVKQVAAHADCEPTLSVQEVSDLLGYSARHVRRMAPRLGGRRLGGRWKIDECSVREHIEGRARLPSITHS
jgi:hypothetical protein